MTATVAGAASSASVADTLTGAVSAAPLADTVARATPAAPLLSVVVPTRNELGNVAVLVEALSSALTAGTFELIFADDSDDGTDIALEALAGRLNASLTVVHRARGMRVGGLGGAVAEVVRLARGEWVCVMDGDLQHPPEAVARMLARAATGDVDLVVASRYCTSNPHLFNRLRNRPPVSRRPRTSPRISGRLRTLCSRAACAVAAGTFPGQVESLSDPMSGFFLVRNDALVVEALRPLGFKILLEILVRHPGLRVDEIAFVFGQRRSGQTKASALEAIRLVRQIIGALPARGVRAHDHDAMIHASAR